MCLLNRWQTNVLLLIHLVLWKRTEHQVSIVTAKKQYNSERQSLMWVKYDVDDQDRYMYCSVVFVHYLTAFHRM